MRQHDVLSTQRVSSSADFQNDFRSTKQPKRLWKLSIYKKSNIPLDYTLVRYNLYGRRAILPAILKGFIMQTIANNAVVVLSSQTKNSILERCASGNWGVSSERILQNRYLVVARNQTSDVESEDVEHGSAFLIGRISKVLETDETTKDGSPRYAIAFDAYAEVNIPNVWGKSRNPVWFTDLGTLGIDVSEFEFIDVEDGSHVTVPKPLALSEDGISFAEARRGLAARYGVSPNNVEIVLRG